MVNSIPLIPEQIRDLIVAMWVVWTVQEKIEEIELAKIVRI